MKVYEKMEEEDGRRKEGRKKEEVRRFVLKKAV